MWGTERLRQLATLVAALVLLCGLLACDESAEEPAGQDGGTDRGAGRITGERLTAARMQAQEQRILDQRARAVREGDLELFLSRVDRRDTALRARQRRYFENLVQLPLARFAYRVSREQWQGLSVPRERDAELHVPRVRLVLQLDGYDAVPVQQTVGFVFAFREGRATIVSDRTRAGPLIEGAAAPWDLTAITVREGAGVLGIFDSGTRASAPAMVAAVRNGIEAVSSALPFDWDARVVVYNVASRGVLDSFTDVPGGALEHLGAMTFPVRAAPGRGPVASTRMLVMPSSVEAGEPFLGRITRHELSHLAIGPRDDGAPTWLSEGIAEYLGARPVPVPERIIPTAAVDRSRVAQGGMPPSPSFNNTDQEWHYALSWMACDHIAATAGEARLWELVEAMHNAGAGTTDLEQDRVLEQVLGYDSQVLARRAAARIQELFG